MRARALAVALGIVLAMVGRPSVGSSADALQVLQTISLAGLDPPSPDPSGIAYLPASGNFVIADSEVDETALYRGVNLFEITTRGALVRTGTTSAPNLKAFSNEPAGLAFDPATGTLIVCDDDQDDLSFVRAGPDETFGTSDDVVREVDTRFLVGTSAADPEGVALDPKSGEVFLVDGVGAEVYRWHPGPDRIVGTPDDMHAHWDLGVHGVLDAEGITYDPGAGTLLVIDKRAMIYELDLRGRLIRVMDARASGAVRAAGIELAPSSVDPSRSSIWIVDRGVDQEIDPTENDGKLIEMTRPVGTPVVTITEPAANATARGATRFSASALDPEDGDVSASIRWSSNRDGVIGSGAVVTAALSAGVHVVRATAADAGGATGAAAIAITVVGEIDIAVAAGADDVEEARADGTMDLRSETLDLTIHDTTVQRIGLRFAVPVPSGARLRAAWIAFTAVGERDGPSRFVIAGEAADDAAPFTGARGDLSQREHTASRVAWSPQDWTPASIQRTPDLSRVVGEILGRGGWHRGNALALFIEGVGLRAAAASESGAPPVLHLEWS